jgi:hypothetical protein
MEDKSRPAEAKDIIKLAIAFLQLGLQILAIWRENKKAVSIDDIDRLIDSIDKDRKIFS